MSTERALAVEKARNILNFSQRELAAYVGVSLRTLHRRMDAAWMLDPEAFHKLARGVYPRDPALAGQLAAHGRTTVQALGLVAPEVPATPPQAPPPPPVATAFQLDAVLCAAAEAADLSPRLLRPAVSAAFARAAEMGLCVEAVVRATRKAPERPQRKI